MDVYLTVLLKESEKEILSENTKKELNEGY